MGQKAAILIAFIVLKWALHYTLISPVYDLQRDEFLHLDQANHLAWGYLSVPPFTSWNSWLIRFLGHSVFWVKFFPCLWGTLTMVVVWKTINELKGDLFALTLGLTGVLFSALLRLNLLYQPNSLDVLCWTAGYYLLIKFINTEDRKWLYALACVLVIGFLNKYNIVFQLLGLLPAVLLVKERRLFFTKHTLFAGGVALLLVLPNLWWQYEHSFPVVHHMRELSERQLSKVNRSDFLKAQVLFFVGSFFLIITALISLSVSPHFRKFRVLGWSLLFTLSLFLYFKAKDYYAIGLYPIYVAMGAVAFSSFSRAGWKRMLRPLALMLPLLSFIPMYRFVFPNRSPEYIVNHREHYQSLGMLRWEDGKDHVLPQDFADMLGWKELAEKVDRAYHRMPEKEYTLVLCDNYGQAGAINYYSKAGIRAVSFNADYLYWFDLTKSYRHLIRVKEEKGSEEELAETSPYFEASALTDSIANVYAREYGTKVFSFVGAKIPINPLIKQELEEKKRKWEK
jgi:hypothetical protein